LIQVGDQVGDQDYSLYGQEMNGSTWALCRMNMLVHNKDAARIEWGDTINNPKLIERDSLMKFDVVVANPPFSLDKWDGEVETEKGKSVIEVLPPEWDWSKPEILERFNRYTFVPENVAEEPNVDRLRRLAKFKLEYFQVFNRHRFIEENFSILIRSGYLARNPINPRFRRNLRDRVDGLVDESEEDLPPLISTSGLNFALLGAPGMGKTQTLAKVLRLYPQKVHHENYRNDPMFRDQQVVWLFLNCPHDSSTRGLCLQFLGELGAVVGENYYDT
jgi:hypothetical protein